MNFSNITIKKKLLLGNSTTLAVLVILCGIVWGSINTLNSTADMVSHTYEVIENASGLVNAMVDQETGLRGFSVSGQDNYLEPYVSGKQNFDTYWKKAKQLTSDNSKQQKRLDAVAADAKRWQTYAENMIELRRNILAGESTNLKLKTLIFSGVGKEKMDAIRKEVADGNYNQVGDRIIAAMVNMETGLRGFMLNKLSLIHI